MKVLLGIISLVMIVPTVVNADKIKEVIITDSVPLSVEVLSGDTPIQVELAPSTIVSTVPVPTVAARTRSFHLNNHESVAASHKVERDSILKYVNTTFGRLTGDSRLTGTGEEFNPEGDMRCRASVHLKIGGCGFSESDDAYCPPAENILLSIVQVGGGRVRIEGGVFSNQEDEKVLVPQPQPNSFQIATGDLFVPAGSRLALSADNPYETSRLTCWVDVYGLLFEQD